MRRAARVDGNHSEIVDALRKCGASVLDLSRVGEGCPDILVGMLGRNVLLEIKTAKGAIRPQQREVLEAWRGEAYIVRSVDEALQAILKR
jgi:Holliday junction resolvase